MHRLDVIQGILDRKRGATYLEIGVRAGQVFLRVRARRKIAVDPEFKISALRRLRYCLENPSNLRNRYFETTSDGFFERDSAALDGGVDVAFIDGLHTYRQCLADVENCLSFLKPDGIIVIHDCSPPSAAAAIEATSVEHAASFNHPDWSNEWTGDVFKTVLHLRATREDLEIFVLDFDYGVGIVRRAGAQATLDLPLERVARMEYHELDPDRERLLNLKPPGFFHDWLATLT